MSFASLSAFQKGRLFNILENNHPENNFIHANSELKQNQVETIGPTNMTKTIILRFNAPQLKVLRERYLSCGGGTNLNY